MSVWIRAFANEPVELSSELLREAIAHRLGLLTYLFCPEDEEEPDDVLSRLKIDSLVDSANEPVFKLHYSRDPEHFIRLERSTESSFIKAEISELLEFLDGRSDPGVIEVRSLVQEVKQAYALELKGSDLNSMGWPLAIAVAAFIAEQGRGVIQADSSGWMLPAGREVSWLVDE